MKWPHEFVAILNGSRKGNCAGSRSCLSWRLRGEAGAGIDGTLSQSRLMGGIVEHVGELLELMWVVEGSQREGEAGLSHRLFLVGAGLAFRLERIHW